MQKLLSNKYKIPGIVCITCAFVLAYFYFYYDMRVALPVFAVYSSIPETKIFTIFETNFSEELILLLLITGFSLVVFSEEKSESHCLRAVRIKAVIQTILIYIFWLAFSVMFVFGNGFVSILELNIVLPFIIYLILFYSKKNKVLKIRRLRRLQQLLLKPMKDSKDLR